MHYAAKKALTEGSDTPQNPLKTSAGKGKRKEKQQPEGKRAEGEALSFLRTCVS